MTLQEKLATRLYELLPHKNKCVYSLMSCGRIPCKDQEHFDAIRLADLLMAMGFENFGNTPDTDTKEDIFWDILNKYNLSKDNVLDQSNDFCEFVLELLK